MYTPRIMMRQHTCVGLAFELINRWLILDRQFPGFAMATSCVSCEESVMDVTGYIMKGYGPYAVKCAEKEHVVVCVQVVINGRPGVMIADPGYHMARVINVMHDQLYPHTGWFKKCEEPGCHKDYKYAFNALNTNYVEWKDRVVRGTSIKIQTSLIFVAQPFLDGVYITEKRNLVYDFRSLVARDNKGGLVAGFYFHVIRDSENATFTIFTTNRSRITKSKYKFNEFRDPNNVRRLAVEEIEKCSIQMRYPKQKLIAMIFKIANILRDQPFVNGMLNINDEIMRVYSRKLVIP